MSLGVKLYDEARLQGRLWTPELLKGSGGLKAWFDAGDLGSISASAGVLTQLRDRSGFGLHATGFNSPTWDNRTQTVTNGGSQSLQVSGMPTTYDMVSVGRPFVTGYNAVVFNVTGGGFPAIIEGGTRALCCNDGAFKQAGTLTWPGGEFGILYMSMPSSTSISLCRNGGTLVACAAHNVTASSSIELTNKSGGGGGLGWGDANELIFVAPSQPARIKALLEGYVAWKWTFLDTGDGDLVALLPGTHPFKTRPPLIGD